MADAVKHDDKGRWPPGRSGNVRGRPSRNKVVKVLATASDLCEVVMDVANRRTTITIEGRREEVTVFESNTIGLASGPAASRLARKGFIDLVMSAARQLDYARRYPQRTSSTSR